MFFPTRAPFQRFAAAVRPSPADSHTAATRPLKQLAEAPEGCQRPRPKYIYFSSLSLVCMMLRLMKPHAEWPNQVHPCNKGCVRWRIRTRPQHRESRTVARMMYPPSVHYTMVAAWRGP
jgi:hypothetical protein